MRRQDDSKTADGGLTFTRRGFLGAAGAAAMGLVFLPGIGRVHARPYEHAGRADDYDGRLCYNENPLGPSPLALAAHQDAATLGHRYPDWYSSSLESAIAAHQGLSSSQICAGVGATELIHLIAQGFLGPGDEVITAYPSYGQIESEALALGASYVQVPLKSDHTVDLVEISGAIGPNTRMIYLVNPNNPTGTIVDKLEMQGFVESLPDDIILVVDEAYHDYVESSDYESCIRYVEEGHDVVVVRTFSKAYGMAGMRVGYAVASSDKIGLIGSSQPFGMVTRPAQAAAIAALGDPSHLASTVALNNLTRTQLLDGAANMGLGTIGAHTNFIMIDVGTDASAVRSELLTYGYQVRSGWGMPNHLRVSTGTEAEIAGFLIALEEILAVGVGETPSPSFAMMAAYPNPFNGRCAIPISVHEGEPVRLLIYDLKGRRVKSLVNGPLDAGRHEINWDGTDHRGKLAASGTYFVNLLQGEFATSQKVMLIK